MAEDNVASRIAGGVRNELLNQWLGVDDFGRVLTKAGEGNFLGALKSLGTGTLELGGTVASLLAAPFTGGGSLAARGGLALGVRGATKAPRILSALQKAGKAPRLVKGLETAAGARRAAKVAAAGPRAKLIERVTPLRTLQERMLLTPKGTGVALYNPAEAAASVERARQMGRNPLRAAGIIDPTFSYRSLGTLGSGRITGRLPSSLGAYTRGAARFTGLVPFAGQSLPSFALQRSVVPRMLGEFVQGPPADVTEGLLRTGANQLSQADLDAMLAAAELGPEMAQLSPLEAYLRGIPQ
jgi:hypothetical protein